MNNITILGNVGKDAELTYTKTGKALVKFNVAVNKITGKGESRQEKTTWFRVTLWQELAEALAPYIQKGDKIAVRGEIDLSTYVDKDGKPAGTLELTGKDVDLIGKIVPRSPRDGGGDDDSDKGRDYDEDTNDIPF